MRSLPHKLKDMLHIWSEFNMLSVKYNALNIAHGTPTLDAPDFLKENLKKATSEGHNQYTMLYGHPILREAIAKHYSPKVGHEIDMNSEIVVTNGASGSLGAALLNLAGPGDEVVTFTPYYPNYASMIHLSGAKMITTPITSRDVGDNKIAYDYDFDAFEASLNPKTQVVLLTNPHNPTGKCLTHEEIVKISEILDRKAPQAWVISDDVYDSLIFDNKEYQSFSAYGDNWDRTLTIYSAGKLMNCTGWKVGWTIGPSIPVREVCLAHESAIFNLNVPG
jgi:aspartate/methionine/tyrosine aminotransferase